MGVGSSQVEFDGDAGKVLAEMRKIADAQRRLEQGAKSLAEVAKTGSAEAQKAYEKELTAAFKLEQKKKDLRKELDEMTKAQQKHGSAFAGWTDAAGGKLTAIGATMGVTIGAAMTKIIASQIEWNNQLANTVRKHDEIARKLQTMALMEEKEFKKVMSEQIFPAAQKYAVSPQKAIEAASQLHLAGDVPLDKIGPVLEETFAAAKATGADDISKFAEQSSVFLKSGGAATVTPGMMRGLGRAMHPLRDDISGDDLAAMAQMGDYTRARGIDPTKMIGMAATMRDAGKLGEGGGVGGIQKLLERLSDPEIAGKLNTLQPGLADKVDMFGETIPQGLQNLKDALDRLDPKSREAAAAEIFGGKSGRIAGETLLARIPQLQGNLEAMGKDPEGYAKGTRIGTSGAAAAAARAEIAAEQHKLATGNLAEKNQLISDIAKQVAIEQGGVAGIAEKAGIGGVVRGTAGVIGVDLEANYRSGSGPMNAEIIRRFEEYQKGAQLGDMPGVGGPKIAPLRAGPKYTGPKLSVDLNGPKFSEEDLAIERANNAARVARIAAQEGKLGAELPGTDWGTRVSPAEQQKIDALERAAKALEIAADKLEAAQKEKKTQDKEEKLKKTPPAANRNAQT